MANNFPNLRPTLNLDMVNGIYVDPRITFTRAGTRTYYGQEVVKAEENLLLQSQTFDNASWTKSDSTVTANTTVAPDGTTTADSLIENSANTNHSIVGVVLPVAASLTYSLYAKANTRDWCYLRFGGDTNKNVYFDLLSGVVGTTDSGITASIQDAGSGWYRCIATLIPATTANSGAVIGIASADNTRIYTGDGTSGIFIWGAQLEQRSFATAYTATTTQPITRYQRQLKTAAANEWPREFDPVTGECLGRSVWESRTNLATYSEDFSNAAWTKSNTTISANQIIAPDGTLTADKLVEDATLNLHRMFSTAAAGAANTYTASVYAKYSGRDFICIRMFTSVGNNYATAVFNVNTGVVGATASSAGYTSLTSTITAVGNGWYRCSFKATAAGAVGNLLMGLLDSNTADINGGTTYTGDGYSGIYIWGAMFESGAFATPYTPTVASQVTRVADSAAMTGVNFSSWFNPEQGCLFMQSAPAVLDAGNGVTISDNTANNRIRLGSSTTEQGTVTVSGTAQAALDGGTPVLNTLQSVAMSYKFNDFALSLNGGAVTTDTTGTVPVVTQLAFATNEYIRRFTYYPQALTSANLQAVTR
jgi:roadblock/LC7 domain-containing protein